MSKAPSSRTHRPLEEELAGIRLFQDLPAPARASLAGSASRRTLLSGEALWKHGKAGGFFAVVTRGWIEISRPKLLGGANTCLGAFGRGEAVGLETLFRDAPFEGSAIAAQDGTEVLIFDPRQWGSLRPSETGSGPIAEWFREARRHRDRALLDQIDVLTAGSVERKLLVLLRQFARRFGKDSEDGFELPLAISKTQVSRILDVRVEDPRSARSTRGSGRDGSSGLARAWPSRTLASSSAIFAHDPGHSGWRREGLGWDHETRDRENCLKPRSRLSPRRTSTILAFFRVDFDPIPFQGAPSS